MEGGDWGGSDWGGDWSGDAGSGWGESADSSVAVADMGDDTVDDIVDAGDEAGVVVTDMGETPESSADAADTRTGESDAGAAGSATDAAPETVSPTAWGRYAHNAFADDWKESEPEARAVAMTRLRRGGRGPSTRPTSRLTVR